MEINGGNVGGKGSKVSGQKVTQEAAIVIEKRRGLPSTWILSINTGKRS